MSAEESARLKGRVDQQPASNGGREAAIDMAPDEFRKIGYRMVDKIASLLGSMRDRPVVEHRTPEQIKEIVQADRALPEKGRDPGSLLDDLTDQLTAYSLYNGHPRFWGYITSSPAPIGMLGDFLASAVNANVGGWQLAPLATEIETQAVRWIADLISYPVDCGGVLVSGGNMANFVCFLAARTAAAGAEVRTKGLTDKSLKIYASKETHTWIQKATDLFGLGTDAVRWIETDSNHRMSLDDLRDNVNRDRKAGHTPMMIVGTAGTVSTGAIDPLPEIAEFCRKNDIWFHVDGAYGAFAAASDRVDRAILGLREADSIAVDPHKWLYAPLEAGCALVRDPELMLRAFSYKPSYYHFGEEPINYVDFGLQNSREFRALKVWLALSQVGREGYVEMIEEDIQLAGEMYDAIGAEEKLRALTCNLSIVTFRYLPADLKGRADDSKVAEYLDDLNEEILVKLQHGGELFVSNAVLDGRFVLRACIVNFRTSSKDVRALPGIVVRCGDRIDRDLRPGNLS